MDLIEGKGFLAVNLGAWIRPAEEEEEELPVIYMRRLTPKTRAFGGQTAPTAGRQTDGGRMHRF